MSEVGGEDFILLPSEFQRVPAGSPKAAQWLETLTAMAGGDRPRAQRFFDKNIIIVPEAE